jgi:hypothetical protein
MQGRHKQDKNFLGPFIFSFRPLHTYYSRNADVMYLDQNCSAVATTRRKTQTVWSIILLEEETGLNI